jgi:hypothetical protein
MKKSLFAFVLFVAVLIASSLACTDTVPAALPTPSAVSPGDIAGTAIQQFAAAEATQFSVNIRFTATEQVLSATRAAQVRIDNAAATQQARMDAQATADQMRADIAATQQRKDIEATADQAQIYMANTQSALATSTWEAMTMTALPPHATLTQMAVDNQIVVNKNNVEVSSLDLEKKRDTNRISWQIPLLVSLCILAMFGLWVWRTSRWNTILDGNGVFKAVGFNDRIIVPALLTGPVLEMGRTVSVPEVVDAVTQKEVVINNQRIEALRALSEVSPQSGYQSFNGYFNEAPRDEFDVINGDALPAGIDDESVEALDKEWNEAVNG